MSRLTYLCSFLTLACVTLVTSPTCNAETGGAHELSSTIRHDSKLGSHQPLLLMKSRDAKAIPSPYQLSNFFSVLLNKITPSTYKTAKIHPSILPKLSSDDKINPAKDKLQSAINIVSAAENPVTKGIPVKKPTQKKVLKRGNPAEAKKISKAILSVSRHSSVTKQTQTQSHVVVAKNMRTEKAIGSPDKKNGFLSGLFNLPTGQKGAHKVKAQQSDASSNVSGTLSIPKQNKLSKFHQDEVIILQNELYRYIGVSVGYGVMRNDVSPYNTLIEQNGLLNSLLDYNATVRLLLDSIIDIRKHARGGVAARVYGGYEFPFWHNITAGPEIGVTFYPDTVKRDSASLKISGIPAPFPEPEFTILKYTGKTTAKGYGADVLLKISYQIRPNFSINIRPGVQVAYEKTKVNYTLKALNDSIPLIVFTKTRSSTRVLPELMAGTLWRPSEYYPVFFDLSYQIVFGNNNYNLERIASTRQYLSLGLVSYFDV